ncbi:hypothetical protein [Streptomyces seoulensis]|uniref:hypothetical protein n=1 Tax=Streptomyces seoulensis TaxID=73044 RepID=UPI0033B11BEC
MAELMMFRRDADGQDVEVSGSTVALEVELQRRVEAGLEQMLGIRFVASEYATGPWHRGRIDTLGLDENGSPVVIEFKKGSDSGVLSQAVSYLSWLRSAQHEFETLVGKVLGAAAAESIVSFPPGGVGVGGAGMGGRAASGRGRGPLDSVRDVVGAGNERGLDVAYGLQDAQPDGDAADARGAGAAVDAFGDPVFGGRGRGRVLRGRGSPTGASPPSWSPST